MEPRTNPKICDNAAMRRIRELAARLAVETDIGKFQVMSFDRETGEIERLTSEHGGGLRPIVSPDGKWLGLFAGG